MIFIESLDHSEDEDRIKKCPNCERQTLKFFSGIGLWICSECEYNSPDPTLNEAISGTFR